MSDSENKAQRRGKGSDERRELLFAKAAQDRRLVGLRFWTLSACWWPSGILRPDAFVGKNGDRDLFADQEAGSEDQSTA